MMKNIPTIKRIGSGHQSCPVCGSLLAPRTAGRFLTAPSTSGNDGGVSGGPPGGPPGGLFGGGGGGGVLGGLYPLVRVYITMVPSLAIVLSIVPV